MSSPKDDGAVSLHDLCPTIDDDTIRLTLNSTVYNKSTILKTCYLFTDRAYVYITVAQTPSMLYVFLGRKDKGVNLTNLGGSFLNELLSQELRQLITAETGMVRQLLIAQAFAEGITKQDSSNAVDIDDYHSDPYKIGPSA